jgi:hypothetical protein
LGLAVPVDDLQGRCPWLSHFAPLGLRTHRILNL